VLFSRPTILSNIKQGTKRVSGERPKIVVLAGGRGTRLAEETDLRPKPMVDIGEHPMLWHIMKHYYHYGFKEFAIALGYRGDYIKRYFLDYARVAGDITIHNGNGSVQLVAQPREDWTVHLVDTGLDTSTGSRVKRLASLLGGSTFMVTYGDGVSDIRLDQLLAFHRSHGLLGTVTAVRPPARFGGIVLDGNRVREFTEKPQIGEGWINGGFLVFEPDVLDMLSEDGQSLEIDLMEDLSAMGQLAAYRHEGFWQCMDTLRDVRLLQSLWNSGQAPWKTW
jgi:glucose-1-phosphate cytidylyltransferase